VESHCDISRDQPGPDYGSKLPTSALGSSGSATLAIFEHRGKKSGTYHSAARISAQKRKKTKGAVVKSLAVLRLQGCAWLSRIAQVDKR
jgi:hypothetical protein